MPGAGGHRDVCGTGRTATWDVSRTLSGKSRLPLHMPDRVTGVLTTGMHSHDISGGQGPGHLLTVDVGEHRCGLRVEDVVEVHAAVRVDLLPGAPDPVVGVVNRHGQPLPVLDLRRRLGLPTRPARADDRLVVVRMPDREVGVLVDAAVDVVTVPAATLDEAVATGTGAALSLGVVVLPDGLLVVLDTAAFLSTTQTAALDDAVQRALAAAPA